MKNNEYILITKLERYSSDIHEYTQAQQNTVIRYCTLARQWAERLDCEYKKYINYLAVRICVSIAAK